MSGEKILIVDDEENILELLSYNLEKNGYHVITAGNGEDAVKVARAESPGLIILDLMLPGIDGLEVCRRLRSGGVTSAIPIVMLTAKGEDTDIVAGLEIGADDYVTKPFSVNVLIARVRAVLRKRAGKAEASSKLIKYDTLTIDPEKHEVYVKKRLIDLTHSEFLLLSLLAENAGRVFTRQQIIDHIRGEDAPITERAVDVQVVGLRKKLGTYGRMIATVRGVGYKFQDRANA
jgi:two-component system alkaline phosphatase synthesis response regulator PhoP